MDCATCQKWIDLDLEGELPAAERRELAAHLAGCAECEKVRAEGAALLASLAGDRLAVRPGFSDAVMQVLPARGWEARHPRWCYASALRSWRAAALFELAARLVKRSAGGRRP